MSVGKSYATSGESIHVWCLNLWMTFKIPYPVIQIINTDPQDIGFLGQAAGRNKKYQEYRSCKKSLHDNRIVSIGNLLDRLPFNLSEFHF